MIDPKTVPCKFGCGRETTYTGTRMCDPCYTARTAVLYTDPKIIENMVKMKKDGTL